MEPRFGHNFGNVRVHTGEKAAESARAVDALAYTVGRDVVFGAGRYAPGTAAGQRLLAHELAHVVQQREPATGSGGLFLDSPGTASEREAEAVSRAVASGRWAPAISSPPAARLQRQMGGVKVAERRQQEEARLPAKFPDKGIRVIGSDAAALVAILSDCTGILLTLDADGMLVALAGPIATPGKVSPTARAELSALIKGPTGVIIDTNPAAEAVVVGTFSQETPGYQRIDVGNIRAMAAATGEKAGLSACDTVMHEISEAVAGRKVSLESGVTGRQAFEPAHAEGTRVEDAIRGEFGLPLRSKTEHGDLVMMGQESATTRLLLKSLIFVKGRQTYTQLSLLRFTLTSDQQVVASHVVKGQVRFSTQRQALEIFNRFASKFGFRPLAIPEELK
jgi:Domain of unknown function (DUF4157)